MPWIEVEVKFRVKFVCDQETAGTPAHCGGAVREEPDAGLQPSPTLGAKHAHSRHTGTLLVPNSYICRPFSLASQFLHIFKANYKK